MCIGSGYIACREPSYKDNDAVCGFILCMRTWYVRSRDQHSSALQAKKSDWPVMQLAAVTTARKPDVELTALDIPCESYVGVCV